MKNACNASEMCGARLPSMITAANCSTARVTMMDAGIEFNRMNTAWLKKLVRAAVTAAMLFTACAAQQQAQIAPSQQSSPAQKLPDAPKPQPSLPASVPRTAPVEQTPQPDAGAQPSTPGTPRSQ